MIKNNNPGNIRASKSVLWQGQTGQDDRGFVIFDTLENGTRALCRVLFNYQALHDLHCVEDWITRFAPPSENDTAAYIADVCQRTKWRPEEWVDLVVPGNLAALAAAVAHHETGEWLDSTLVASSANQAIA